MVFKRLREALNPQVEKPRGTLSGETAVTFGCADCALRSTVVLQTPGAVGLTMRPSLVPFSAEVRLRVDDPRAKVNISSTVSTNQRPCADIENGCPYGDAVTEVAESIRLSPLALDMMVSPRVDDI